MPQPPTRIEPQRDAVTGKPLELNPPASGLWLRDADGGLTPADQATAERAGLAWPSDETINDVLGVIDEQEVSHG